MTFFRRIGVALLVSLFVYWLLHRGWHDRDALLTRTITLGLVGALAFSFFERWPRWLPSWIARWALQVIAVGVAMPATTLAFWLLTGPRFWESKERMDGWMMLTFMSILLAPWTALAAVVRQKEALFRHQALEFELQRSELEREALDARLRLLRAQVAPHFLFNTLANVRALVDAGSPQASALLGSLIRYLRAAVPHLDETVTTIGEEVELTRSYLELMQMRMPDRLQYNLSVDEEALAVRCPPTALLTLVENAVRHGIDPSEDGGRIDIDVRRGDRRCIVHVSDTGVGLHGANASLGTGLAALRERLQLMFRAEASLDIAEVKPHGVRAKIEIPVTT